jgi:mono/diheme cytochrome c family protein
MRKLSVFLLLAAACILTYCTSSKKAQRNAVAATPKVTFAADVQPLIVGNCSPCHIPNKGKVKPLESYANAKEEIDDIITRIQKNPGEKGFMPMRHPKLSDSTILVFVNWKKDGLLEK